MFPENAFKYVVSEIVDIFSEPPFVNIVAVGFRGHIQYLYTPLLVILTSMYTNYIMEFVLRYRRETKD